ncbi:lipoprotein N-acyltransferase Lnb domain-containing protein [Urechidicola croceus]|uniref:Uncharacterized protein n=1 Tax=Urechidicola croceus TaxID=1850246 RepID=A0A1D8PBK8_9FLAO|nr:DUF4105 domain-containing protein [Urechidicola croceus]AOW21979.1 hypothetical protein LPB138_01980 [Urechidicola croceus]
MKYFLVTLIAFFFSVSLFSQTRKLSTTAEVSVITCGPGSEFYTAFGHSAFRIRDTRIGLDKVYNYGTFDFDAPNFYGKFVKGNLMYFLSAYDFGHFLKVYNYENRWVTGQVLDLNPKQVQKVFNFLEKNARPENREYRYDYFYDNCSTRLYDVIYNVIGKENLEIPIVFSEDNLSHRQMMQEYFDNQPWGDFGIDLALGSPFDKSAAENEYLFLPENVMRFFNQLKIIENKIPKPIVKRTEIILPNNNHIHKTNFLNPFLVFSIIGVVVLWITKRNMNTKKRSRWLDFLLFFITGLIGCIISFMWFATDHTATAKNFNTLWAFAPNIIISFFMLKKNPPKWVYSYTNLLLILIVINVFIWILKIQIFSISVIPILIFLTVRYYYIGKYNRLLTSKK